MQESQTPAPQGRIVAKGHHQSQRAPQIAHVEKFLESTKEFYEKAPVKRKWPGRFYIRLLASFYNHLIPDDANVLEIGCGTGDLLDRLHTMNVTGVDLAAKPLEAAREKVPHGEFYQIAGERLSEHPQLSGKKFDYIVVSETVNYAADVQQLLAEIQKVSHANTRVVLNFFNTLWKPALMLLTSLGLRSKNPSLNWLSHDDMKNLLDLSSWELIRQQHRILLPLNIPVVSNLLNKYLAPFLPWFCWTIFQVARSRVHRPLVNKLHCILSTLMSVWHYLKRSLQSPHHHRCLSSFHSLVHSCFSLSFISYRENSHSKRKLLIKAHSR